MLTAPKASQKRYAGQIAWERGKKIVNMPDTSSGVSGLIQNLLSLPALPVEDWQLDSIRNLLAQCVEQIDGFDPADYSELPEDRGTANKIRHALTSALATNKFRATRRGDLSEFVVDEDSDEAIAAAAAEDVAESVVEDPNVGF